MKHLAGILLISIAQFSVSAQTLPVNESGKITFYEVVKADSLKKGLLYHNAVTWLNSLKDVDNQITVSLRDSLLGKMAAKNEVSVYAQTGILKKLSGKITYSITVEVKDNMYRYNFSDFIFHYYKQDRNYKMVATGKTKNLEDPKAAGWQKLWEKHRHKMAEKIEKDVELLKAKIVEVPANATEQLQKKKEIKWDE